LTHRDSTVKSVRSEDKKLFYRMRRGDVQFSSAGSGVKHTENNESPTESEVFAGLGFTVGKRAESGISYADFYGGEEEGVLDDYKSVEGWCECYAVAGEGS
jgi:hypothetical protein